jgi:hypothetical protein
MRNPVYWPQWMLILTCVAVTGMSATGAKALRPFFAEQHPALAAQTWSAPELPSFRGLWSQVVMPILVGPTLLGTKLRLPNFTERTAILWFGSRTATSVPRESS